MSTTRKHITACGESIVTSDYRIAFYVFAGCMACCCISCLFFKFQVSISIFKWCENIRIHHECEGRIEKSVPGINVWHHEACLVMANGDSEGWIFSILSSHE